MKISLLSTFAFALIVIGICLFSFSGWGYFTHSGNQMFDEMDGLIPYYGLFLSIGIIAIGAILQFITMRKRQNIVLKKD